MENGRDSLIPRLIKSLEKEISSNDTDKNKLVLKITDGQFIGKESKKNVYKFVLDNSIHPIDGIAIELITEKIRAKGNILQSTEHEVNIALVDDIGESIKSAKIEIRFTSIYEILKNKLKELYDSKKCQEYHLANHFFEGYGDNESFSSIMPGFDNLLKEYDQKKGDHNSDNKETKVLSFPESIYMLAHIVGAFIKIDMKVLLISNKNTFINNATLCLADSLLENDLYKTGKIINQVAQDDDATFKDHELIIPKKIIKRFKGLSEQEKATLLEKIKDIDNTLIELAQGLELVQKRDSNFKRVKQISKDIETIEQKITDAEKYINKQEKHIEFLTQKLENKDKLNFIDNFLMKLGINPIQKKLSKFQRELDFKKKELSIIQNRSENMEKQRKNIADVLQNIHNELFSFLGKYNLTESKLHDKYESLISQRETLKIRIADLDIQFKLITSHILSNAVMIGTTLNMTFLSNEFSDLAFDILVVDEASLSAEPQLYWALSKCKMAAIIAGDYLKFVVPNSSL